MPDAHKKGSPKSEPEILKLGYVTRWIRGLTKHHLTNISLFLTKTPMRFANFINYFSLPRIERYLAACSNDTNRCIALYKSNLEVAQAFHQLLGVLEVTLRNGINGQLTTYFGGPDWIINQKAVFMVDPILTHMNKKTGQIETNRFLLNSVKTAEKKLVKRGVKVTSGRIIPEQTFGFWTELFENHHYKILRGRPIKMFKNLPAGHGRIEILNELTKVRQFRNRIYYNEPICFVETSIDFTNASAVYHSIINLLNWINFELVPWVENINKVQATVTKAQSI